MTADFGKVAVLFGGNSKEREVSLLSGKAVYNSLRKNNIEATLIDPKSDLLKINSNNFDRVFLALHGKDGEDGVIQGYLEALNIPFTGSKTMASSLAMDKIRTKQIFEARNLPVTKYIYIQAKDYKEEYVFDFLELVKKVIVKPSRQGSSIGITIATTKSELLNSIEEASAYDNDILIEEFLDAKELTVGILNNKALGVIEINAKNTFYDYQAKYESQNTEYLTKPSITDKQEEMLKNYARDAFEAVDCYGVARIDFLLDQQNKAYLIEINTIPGMTEKSLLPMSAQKMRIDFDELVIEILKSSITDVSKK